MKRITCVITILVLCFASFIAFSPVASAETKGKQIKLTATSFFPETNDTAQAFFMFRDRVNKLSKGDLFIDWIGGPEAIPRREQGKSVSAGVVDMSFTPSAIYSGLVPAEGWITTSRLPYDKEREVGFHDFLNEEHNKAGLYYLGRGAAAYSHKEPRNFHIWLNKKIDTPRGFAGLKIGGSSPASNAFLKALGAAPVVLPHSDTYSALERGVVDGYWTGMASFLDLGGLELVKYYIDHRFATDNCAFIINLKTWNNLPKNLQALLKEVVISVEEDFPKLTQTKMEKGWQRMRDAKIEFIRFSPKDAENFTDTFYKSQWDKMRKANPKNVSRVEKMLLR